MVMTTNKMVLNRDMAITINFSENAKKVLEKRYLRKGPDGKPIETIEELFWRVAKSVADVEARYKNSPYTPDDLAVRFFNLMVGKDFLPNSPTLMNAGTKLGQLAACFVLPVEDSMEGIFDAIKYAALIHKSGGGTGFSFSRLRPKNSRVGSTGGIASGPLSFIKIFNTATEQVKQGGTRRGANMGILRVDHPDIIEFIKAKEKEGELNNFNLSVALTEEFMEAVLADKRYSLIAPHTGERKGELRARDVFNLLVEKAWQSGDPGIIFLDRINRDNPTPTQGEIESTNPCGEQPLLPYEACNLGSINLSNFYVDREDEKIDFDRLKQVVHLCVRFLDNVIDLSKYPIDKITEKVRLNRKIGLGIMGWADLLFKMGIPYNSEEAIRLAEKLMSFIQRESKEASKILAKEKGPFPAYEESIYKLNGEGPYRNATTTTIAPTGTLSIIAECSSGIEPVFSLCFYRHVMDGEKLLEVNKVFKEAFEKLGLYSDELIEDILEKGSIQHLDYIPDEFRRIFVVAHDIEPMYHLKMQAAFQKYTDNAVSKTVNLPNSSTIDDVRNIYLEAYKLGVKGVTVFRDGCKSSQVLNLKKDSEKESKVRQRPDVVYGFTQKVKTGLGTLYLTVNEVDGKPFEVFATIGKSGRSITAKAEAIGRLVSLALRSGVEVEEIVRQLKGIGGEHPVFQKKGLLLSIPDAVAWVLENQYMKKSRNHGTKIEPSLVRPVCPECGEEITFQEGCMLCNSCGYTRC
ncbi:vitamin B12-dependent ribonucleotide reductase [Desulfothermus okinawensis JCM 13304]